MKIETIVKSYANQIVKFADGIRVTFNADCTAEVSEEDGKKLLERYTTQIFPEGKVIQPEIAKSPALPKVDKATINELQEQLQRANHLINDYAAQANTAKEGERVWRNKCTELLGQIKTLQAQLGQKADIKPDDAPKNESEKDSKKTEQVDAAALLEKLSAKTVKELQVIADELKLPQKKLNKQGLVDYIIAATTNATT
jgi:hypothetical protein